VTRSPNGWRRARRRWLLWIVLGLVALAVVLGAVSGFYIDILWFREVGFSTVFWSRFWARILLALSFGAFFFVIAYVNLLIVRRLRPRYRVYSPEEEAVERYRAAFEPYARWVLPGVALLLAVFAAGGVAGRWEEFQLWRVSGDVSFGTVDPLFERDIAFYVLALPFLRFVQGWLFGSLVVIALVTAGGHYLWGGIRLRAVGERFTPQVKAHLSVLLGAIVLVRAWGYRLGQYDLLISERGTVTGASYTDIHAHLPALRTLVIIAIICAGLFLVNIRRRGWALPAFAIGILLVASLLGGALVPAFVQRFTVDPQELQRERPYIDLNIEFTRKAYGIDDVQVEPFPAGAEVTPAEISEAQAIVQNIRQWTPDVLRTDYELLQRIRPYYEFSDVDVDRYVIDGQRHLVMISPREISQFGIPGGGGTWQNTHLFYTHGFGAVATRADQVTLAGAPAFVLSNMPITGAMADQLEEPRVYFQETIDVPFVLVNTGIEEFDFPVSGQEGEEVRIRYSGVGGIDIGGFFRRLAFAWRYRDVNLLISGLVEDDSRILINTDLQTRVQKVAPFLEYDHDPYAAIVDGRLVWIWDAYTTSNTYPYSQRVDLGEVSGEELSGEGNYIRNSVKVVIDAYDGTMDFYVSDPSDPIIQAWQLIFPDLFQPIGEASTDLQAHFRYPEDLFRVQAHQYANYHVTEAGQFYQKEDFWAVPQIPVDPLDPDAATQELQPYYVLITLPGGSEEQFVLFSPFTPADRPNMVAWMAANSDPIGYGELTAFEFQAQNVNGPGQVSALINQETELSQELSLLSQRGSEVIYGDLLAIPIGQSFLYVQPIYVQASSQGIPELKRLVVVNGEQVSVASSLAQALALAFGEATPVEPPDGEPTPPDGEPIEPGQDVAELLAEAEEHFQAAQEALQAGDLATYQAEIEAAQEAIRQAAELVAEPSPSPTPTGGGGGEG
jgi:uncharacterized membrane protein (UPF0182 family)